MTIDPKIGLPTFILLWIVATMAIIGYDKLQTSMAEYKVSYYNKGTITASGEFFDKDNYTCAVAEEDMMGYWYRFESNGKVVYAYANDLIGPAGQKQRRKYELSEAAFARLAPLAKGTTRVTVERSR